MRGERWKFWRQKGHHSHLRQQRAEAGKDAQDRIDQRPSRLPDHHTAIAAAAGGWEEGSVSSTVKANGGMQRQSVADIFVFVVEGRQKPRQIRFVLFAADGIGAVPSIMLQKNNA